MVNNAQRSIIIIGLLFAAGMFLYPPWVFVVPNEAILDLGYAFLLTPPNISGTEDYLKTIAWNTLLAQLAAIGSLTGAVYLLVKDRGH